MVLAGYYGFENLGDELLLEVSLGWLRGLGAVEPWVLSADPCGTRERHGVRAIQRWNPWAVAAALRGAGALVFGGGGIFQDATSARSLRYYLGLVRLAGLLRVPVILLGQGFGPLSERGRARAGRLLKDVAYCLVRDPQSAALARAWGLREVRQAPDLTLTLEVPAAGEAATRPLWGLALRPPEAAAEQALETLSRAVRQVSRATGWTPVGFPCQRQDRDFLRALQERVPELLVLPPLQGPSPRCLALVRDCRLLWGGRLHALVLAALAGVPCIGLGTDPKLSGLLAQLNAGLSERLSCWSLEAADPEALVTATLALERARPSLQAELRRVAAALGRRAQAALTEAGRRLQALLGLHPTAS